MNSYSEISIGGLFKIVSNHLLPFFIAIFSCLACGGGLSAYVHYHPEYKTEKYLTISQDAVAWKGDTLASIANSDAAFELTTKVMQESGITAWMKFDDVKSSLSVFDSTYSVRILITGKYTGDSSASSFLVESHISSIKQRCAELYPTDPSFNSLTVENTNTTNVRVNSYEVYIMIASFFGGIFVGTLISFAVDKNKKVASD